MQRPKAVSGGRDRDREEPPYGETLLNEENVTRLASFATHWCILLGFDNDEGVPKAFNFFPAEGFVGLFTQGKVHGLTMVAGFRTSGPPPRPVPSAFFRTVDFLLQFVVSGSTYRAISDKDVAKGMPPVGWCRVPVIPDHTAVAAVANGTPAQPPDISRLFYSAYNWCFVTTYRAVGKEAIKIAMAVPSDQLLTQHRSGLLSEYTLMVGIADPRPKDIWVAPFLMLPLGALLYIHRANRPYCALTVSELKASRLGGLQLMMARELKPLSLAPPPEVPGFTPQTPSGTADARGAATSTPGDAGGSTSRAAAAGSSRGVSNGGAASQAAAASGGRDVPAADVGASSAPAASAASTAAPTPDASVAAVVPLPVPTPLEGNWIMPAPFEEPVPPPAAAAPEQADTAAAAAAAALLASASALPPSQFLGELTFGCRPTLETSPLRLFLGEKGQYMLTANWWFIDPPSVAAGKPVVRGPFSSEQMLLSYVTGCCELEHETPIVATDSDVKPPMVPPTAAFQKLGDLLACMDMGGQYMLVKRGDLVMPLATIASSLLGNRVRYPPPDSPPDGAAAAAAATGGEAAGAANSPRLAPAIAQQGPAVAGRGTSAAPAPAAQKPQQQAPAGVAGNTGSLMFGDIDAALPSSSSAAPQVASAPPAAAPAPTPASAAAAAAVAAALSTSSQLSPDAPAFAPPPPPPPAAQQAAGSASSAAAAAPRPPPPPQAAAPAAPPPPPAAPAGKLMLPLARRTSPPISFGGPPLHHHHHHMQAPNGMMMMAPMAPVAPMVMMAPVAPVPPAMMGAPGMMYGQPPGYGMPYNGQYGDQYMNWGYR